MKPIDIALKAALKKQLQTIVLVCSAFGAVLLVAVYFLATHVK